MKLLQKDDNKKILIHIALILGTLFMVIPFVWMVLTSFKTLPESIQVPPKIMPKSFNLKSYSDVLTLLPFLTFYLNTVIVIAVRVVVSTFFAAMAAYA